jgi:hypothetical protein
MTTDKTQIDPNVNSVKTKITDGLVDMLLWITISLTSLISVFDRWYRFDTVTRDLSIFKENFSDFIWAAFILIIPILYRLVFGEFMLSAIKRFIRNLRAGPIYRDKSGKSDSISTSLLLFGGIIPEKEEVILAFSPEKHLYRCVQDSDGLAKSIKTRSGVYLLIGCLIAFFGMAFYYGETTLKPESTHDIYSDLFAIVPRFGILLFVELIAFFFLKQYKASMDEFRYYESIKRRREELYLALKIMERNQEKYSVIELMKSDVFFSKNGILEPGQSSELIETRKLEKDEIEILGKMLDVISKK